LLGAPPKSVEVDPTAYALYLQGRYFYGRRTRADWEKATKAYEDALQIDPRYAAAWAGLSRVYYARAGQSYIDLHQGTAQARQAAQKALALQPSLAEGYVSLASIQMTYDWDWAGSEDSLKRALELAPGMADAMASLGILKRYVGDIDEAIELDRRAVALDPLNLPGYHALGLALIYAGRLDEADEVYRHLLTLNPEFAAANLARSRVMLLQGRPDEALTIAEREAEPFWREFGVLSALCVLGRSGEVEGRLLDFVERNQNDGAYQIAQIYGFRADRDKVFEWLERAYKQRDGGLPEMLLDPYLRTFSDDPRWTELLRKVGLYDAWLRQRNS
jgi:tetratricopeptide (TPR) repeat protein